MIITANTRKNFTMMSNYHLYDNRLSLKAKGLLTQMLSLPEDWHFTEANLVDINFEGHAAVRSGLHELEDCGYLRRTYVRSEYGDFAGIEYELREVPYTYRRVH